MPADQPTAPSTETVESADVLVEQGRLLYERGDWEQALATWQAATQRYQALNDDVGMTGSLLNQTKALTLGGHYRQACETILKAIDTEVRRCDFSEPTAMTAVMTAIQTESDPTLQVLKFVSLGNVLKLNGYLPQAEEALEAAIAHVPTAAPPEIAAKVLLSLGKVEQLRYQQSLQLYRQTQEPDDQARAFAFASQALTSYQRAESLLVDRSIDPGLKLQATAQMLDLLIQLQQPSTGVQEAASRLDGPLTLGREVSLIALIQAQLEGLQTVDWQALSPSRSLIDSQLSLAQSLIVLWTLPEVTQTVTLTPTADIEPLLQRAEAAAIALQDMAAHSQTLGIRGHLYEVWGKHTGTSEFWQQAQKSTQQALALAQSRQASYLAYQWSWQLGRLYQQAPHSDPEVAIAYYQAAVDTLTDVRQDLLALNPEVRFALRDNSEPLYREFILLLLDSPAGSSPSQSNLRQAIREVDALQLAQLEDFLSCNLTQQVALEQAHTDLTAAIVYPIILPEQLAVVVQFPDSEILRFYRTALPAIDANQLLDNLRLEVERPFLTQTFFQQSQQIYDWLIRPMEAELAAQTIETLVFVADGALRNVPLSILHDGQQFLIEKYAIALSPGLTLPTSQPLSESNLRALAFGLSETRPDFLPHEGFAPLENVATELAIIQDQLPSQQRLNQSFTGNSLQGLVRDDPAPVVHLATHGQFSSNPDDTFLLAWDRRLTLADLSQLLSSRTDQTAIELLMLSACKTATGDSRATLGLAGVAIQSGARSTIASLWSVDDVATTELMGHFYQALTTPSAGTPVTRAQALRQAQLALLNNPNFRAPIYWSAFVLVGNWQ
ncbi:MAG: CHAT domain-containing protein [Cyanobacteria bacterium J06639_16]